MVFSDPLETYIANGLDEVRPVLARASAAAASGRYVAGFVAYEAAAAFDHAFHVQPGDAPYVWMAAYDGPHAAAERHASGAEVLAPTFAYDRDEYAEAVGALRAHIREGDIYQVNLTASIDGLLRGDARALFEELIDRQPVPYAAYLDTGDVQLVSCSPELFFERRGRHVAARPMKGTVRRGDGAEEDRRLARWLSEDPKSRAENLMIVDLLRNDLSRCCRPGTVAVPELFAVERYETVIQMTSEIRGELRPGAGTLDVFDALFPCGSVTGAPKIRAMQFIDAYERGPRGVYCGAIGIMHGDEAVFNVAIRTITVRGTSARLGVGSGIIWDSDPDAEYEECLLKARFLTDRDQAKRPARLIETMRAEDGVVALLARHLDRLRESARILDYRFPEKEIRDRLAAEVPHSGAYKVRITLGRRGDVDAAVSVLEPGPDGYNVLISSARIVSDDLFRRHKTTQRALYEREYADAVEAGFDEVLFLNEKGDVAEGSRSNIIAKYGNRWVTPPVSSGALPGVYRRYLLETQPHMEEGTLTMAALRRADALYVCNAVRGLVPILRLAPDIDGHP